MTKNEFEKVWNEATESFLKILILASEIGDFYFEEIEDLELKTHLYALLDFLTSEKDSLGKANSFFYSYLFQLQKDGILEKIIDFLKQKRRQDNGN
ncbi:hypothetical protein CCZ01_07845 [Helicobacter monodelphidis]|uniref:hypothetical protein n=1 Tax=Helicobacter sp. 15-1451 TaxID=2004995 RepID=UPI000DCC77A0|nr:hypothetical protein [Helicobacter sp. 15-1451]RAX56956.1 hypothetical protein CCZ01_07845 [Helicobacter sp. 15-1451]